MGVWQSHTSPASPGCSELAQDSVVVASAATLSSEAWNTPLTLPTGRSQGLTGISGQLHEQQMYPRPGPSPKTTRRGCPLPPCGHLSNSRFSLLSWAVWGRCQFSPPSGPHVRRDCGSRHTSERAKWSPSTPQGSPSVPKAHVPQERR